MIAIWVAASVGDVDYRRRLKGYLFELRLHPLLKIYIHSEGADLMAGGYWLFSLYLFHSLKSR